MAQRKPNERPSPANRSEWARLDEDGYELPGPHADVIFALAATPDLKRRRRFWMKVVGRGPVRPTAGAEPEADATSM